MELWNYGSSETMMRNTLLFTVPVRGWLNENEKYEPRHGPADLELKNVQLFIVTRQAHSKEDCE